MKNYSTSFNNISQYVHPKTDKTHLDWNIIYDMDIDDNGYIWAGSPGGLNILAVSDNGFRPMKYYDVSRSEGERQMHEIMSVFKDGDGNMWLSDYGQGLALVSYAQNGIEELDPRDYGVSFSAVTSIYKDGDILWIGIRGQNFIRYDMRRDVVLDDTALLRKFDDDCNAVVGFVSVEEKDLLFLSTRYNGVYMLHKNKYGSVDSVKYIDTAKDGARNAFTNTAVKDLDGNIWVGTKSGIVILREDFGYAVHSPDSLNRRLHNCAIETICADTDGNIWAGSTDSGLFRFTYDVNNDRFSDFREYSVSNGTVRNNKIQTLFEDSKGRLWAGTEGGGLNRYIEDEDRFNIIDNMNLLPSDQIFALTEDDKGCLWVSTANGVIRYDPDATGDGLWNVGIKDELENLSFIKNAVWSDHRVIIFGGYDGLSIFYPDMILPEGEAFVPSIVDVQIFNESVFSFSREERSGLISTLPPFSERITLGHKDNSISFKFVSPILYQCLA